MCVARSAVSVWWTNDKGIRCSSQDSSEQLNAKHGRSYNFNARIYWRRIKSASILLLCNTLVRLSCVLCCWWWAVFLLNVDRFAGAYGECFHFELNYKFERKLYDGYENMPYQRGNISKYIQAHVRVLESISVCHHRVNKTATYSNMTFWYGYIDILPIDSLGCI